MKTLVAFMFVLLLSATQCLAQDAYRSNPRYAERYEINAPRLYSGNGTYLGELSLNRHAPNSVSNPYGVYGSRYSPQSINNPYSPYGQYRTQPVYVLPRNR
jgi:hypothetical protein